MSIVKTKQSTFTVLLIASFYVDLFCVFVVISSFWEASLLSFRKR